MEPDGAHRAEAQNKAEQDMEAIMQMAAWIVEQPFGDTSRPSEAAQDSAAGSRQAVEASEALEQPQAAGSSSSEGSDDSDEFTTDEESSEDEQENADRSAYGATDIEDVPLDDEGIEKLLDRLVEVETEAAEAQEMLEDESLNRVEEEVRSELSATLSGSELERELIHEMMLFTREWERKLVQLQNESGNLQDLLDDAGVSLPDVFKSIEKTVAEGCTTEAWRKRTHWVGSDASEDFSQIRKSAEKDLNVSRPVIRRRGRLVEEGASGFLVKKLECTEVVEPWEILDGVVNNQGPVRNLICTKEWAAVYAASTPQQAVRLGLKFPGAFKVDEIADIDGGLETIALEEESKHGLTEEQRKNVKRVLEVDDVRHSRKRPSKEESRPEMTRDGKQPDLVVLSDDDDTPADTDGSKAQSSTFDSSAEKDCQETKKGAKRRRQETPEASVGGTSKRLKVGERENDVVVGPMNLRTDTRQTGSVSARSGTEKGSSKFACTICTKPLAPQEVAEHTLLPVIVCGTCKAWYEALQKDSVGQCGWCGGNGEPLRCNVCDKTFCRRCVERNLGSNGLTEILETLYWECFYCDTSQLTRLSRLLKKAQKRSGVSALPEAPPKNFELLPSRNIKQRRNIRKVLPDHQLSEQTKQYLALEKERRERLKKWYDAAEGSGNSRSSYNKKEAHRVTDDTKHLCEGDCRSLGCVINIAGITSKDMGEPMVRTPLGLSRVLKPHQLSGVRFMWENCVVSFDEVKKAGSKALGCILAHSMGLGKTLQVITFLYTVMRVAELGFKTALIVLPVNVLHNWRLEFDKWKPDEVKALPVYMLEDVSRDNRATLLGKWQREGGVMLIGYAAFRNLSMGRHVKDESTRDAICACLQNPGPDLLICDEAHTIKNKKADITQGLKHVKTKRRIALTGSPLQNNLMEYYCMVDFVREGFLGRPCDFRNRFQNPIENGQHADSTAEDVKKMKQRSHVLHNQLSGFVQRRGMSALKHELPPKCVWVVSVRLSQLQRDLYKKYLSVCGKQQLFDHYHSLAKIWNHPDLLLLAEKDIQQLENEDCDEEVESAENGITKPKPHLDPDWWKEILAGKQQEIAEHSGKIVLTMKLLRMSASEGEKMLIFSQSLGTLDLLERFMADIPTGNNGHWQCGKEWFRIDGNVPSSRRQKIVDLFNKVSNTTVKCVLISTRAGSLGINLIGATRVIIVDGSWNPTHDLQALFRAWRIGQTKPVHVYRLLAYGTMEEKIYNRQLTKESVAARVLDEHQVGRHLNADDLQLLYTLDDDEDEELENNKDTQTSKKFKQHRTFSAPTDAPPRDDLLALLLLEFRPKWIAKYHEHEPLLENLEDEELSPEDKAQAWELLRQGHEGETSASVQPVEVLVKSVPEQQLQQPVEVLAPEKQPQQPVEELVKSADEQQSWQQQPVGELSMLDRLKLSSQQRPTSVQALNALLRASMQKPVQPQPPQPKPVQAQQQPQPPQPKPVQQQQQQQPRATQSQPKKPQAPQQQPRPLQPLQAKLQQQQQQPRTTRAPVKPPQAQQKQQQPRQTQSPEAQQQQSK